LIGGNGYVIVWELFGGRKKKNLTNDDEVDIISTLKVKITR
jgi:hypothetical protein